VGSEVGAGLYGTTPGCKGSTGANFSERTLRSGRRRPHRAVGPLG